MTNVAKDNCHPEQLSQMALDVIDNIPVQDFTNCSDGSRLDSEVVILTPLT